ncbi:hypothetical protein [Paramuribaculum intestinale]|uniref:hypothetical protein n=1 Tax=Paramuribaculum intestinale TaxID=2094151 RepID=UPI0025A9FA38|nr:hypothetical protein [Paramuribaculum intestinale]
MMLMMSCHQTEGALANNDTDAEVDNNEWLSVGKDINGNEYYVYDDIRKDENGRNLVWSKTIYAKKQLYFDGETLYDVRYQLSIYDNDFTKHQCLQYKLELNGMVVAFETLEESDNDWVYDIPESIGYDMTKKTREIVKSKNK